MGNIASVLVPLGAQLIKGNGSTPSLDSGINTSGSAYDLNSGNGALINSTPSTTQWLIIGAIVLGGLFLLKK
jgi:hypothetical protein